MKSMPVAILQVIASGAFSVATLTPAMAQQAAAEPVQRVVVTGSLISRTDTETAAPVQVITAADIQRSGKTSIAELLQDLAANGAGTLGTGFSGAFANGASGVSLRGLTVGSTLVLIDGHRMSPYAIGDDSQRSFVDVSNIPFDAIDSIEVLKSGASSLYGSDAVAGVVNIKLKKSFNGTRFAADAGNSQHGGGRTQRASLSTGFGDIDADGYNVFLTAEWRKQNAIKVSQRSQYDWDDLDWSKRGGQNLTYGVPTARNGYLTAASSPFLYFQNPNNPINPATGKQYANVDNPANYQFLDPKCNFNLYRAGGCSVEDTYGNIQPETENKNLLVGYTKKLGNDWELAFKGSIFQRDNLSNRGLPGAYSPTSFAGYNVNNNGALNPGVGAMTTTFGAGKNIGTIANPFAGTTRLYGYIPGLDGASQAQNRATTSRFAVDLRGSAYGWDLNVAGGLTKSKAEIDYSGYVDRGALYSLLNAGKWNPLGGNSQDLINQVSPRFTNTLESKLNYFDFVGSRELTQWGAGPIALAGGVHWHKRTWNAPPSSLTANGQVASTSAFVFGEETNTAAFAELQATPIKDVEVHVSSRYDHFDNNHSFTPATSVKWAPSKQFALRGTFARGFRAPNPAETGNSGSFFVFNGINDPVLCPTGNQNAAGTVPTACGINPTYVQRPNKDLSPEKSKSYTLGVVLEPFKGLNATLDYYRIDVKNQIVTAAGNDPSYSPTFVRGPAVPIDISTGVGEGTVVGVPSVGPILFAESQYINAGVTKTTGLEGDIGYRWNLGDKGVIRANLSAAHTISYEQTIAGVTYQLAGTQGPSVVSGATGSPKNRAQLSLGWTKGPLDVNTTFNYTSSFSALDPSVEGGNDCSKAAQVIASRLYYQNLVQPGVYCKVSSFTSTNLNVQYKVSQNLTLKGSILNLFDRQPPFDLSTYGNATTQTSYNASLHQAGAIGRFFSLGLAYTF
ncbi:TonB-dependent receptor [Duganella sp. sic0402]|uniref:TonB-dependent receptor n=1 Tax=Duganella sp. sic0402 TaxID=2854786 RepID=UPI001C453375|nr:TonB-dependent receptor [Duganella sp. sic0402]MBV7536595.1 TonB-dependent receptor [Duganella sp. sic0402]